MVAVRRPPLVFLLRVLLLAGWPLAGCTPALTADDARPFQACTVDADCGFDALSCDGCGAQVAIANARRQDFEALRGCWQPGPLPTTNCKLDVGPAGCRGGRCSPVPRAPSTQGK